MLTDSFPLSHAHRNYHSEGDAAANLNSTQGLCSLATSAARTLYSLAGGPADVTRSISANCSLLADVLFCLTANWSCDTSATLGFFFPPDYPPPNHYVSTFRFLYNIGVTPLFVQKFLATYSKTDTGDLCDDGTCPTVGDTCLNGNDASFC